MKAVCKKDCDEAEAVNKEESKTTFNYNKNVQEKSKIKNKVGNYDWLNNVNDILEA